MTLTVKLSPEIERDLTLHCQTEGLTKSEVVTRLIQQYLLLRKPAKTAYDLAQAHGLIGCYRSDQTELGRNHSRHIKEKLRAKRTG